MRKANDLEVDSITLPIISRCHRTNPNEKCAEIIIRTIVQFIDDAISSKHISMIKYIRLTNYWYQDVKAIKKYFYRYLLAQDSSDIKSNEENFENKIVNQKKNNNKACCLAF